jgi:hypothetical protein
MTCYEKDEENAKKEAGEDMDKLKQLTSKIRVHKYIGESARSVFERSWEHMHDFENLSTKSHLLKHAVDQHQTVELCTLKFGIKVLKYARSAFERQIFESVSIEENRHHFLLNSHSEYNRSAIPRLMCKLGDKSYKKYEKEVDNDLEKEEEQVGKIRELVKERNKLRAQNQRRMPPPKRRKLGSKDFEQRMPHTARGEQTGHYSGSPCEVEEKRKMEDTEDEAPPAKRKNLRQAPDIRDMFTSKDKTTNPEQEQDQDI